MEGEQDAVRTLECLRGRLVAERSASKAAKQDADTMAKKLQELEEKLRVEAKARRRAEKKLNLLKKKLESLHISLISEDSGAEQQSSSSDNFDPSISATSTDPDETEPKSETTKGSTQKHGSFELAMVQSVSPDEDPFDKTLEFEEESGDFGSSGLSIEDQSHQDIEWREKSSDSKVFCSRSMMSSTNDTEKDAVKSRSNNEDDLVADNSMALVLITPLATSQAFSSATEVTITDRHPREVLNTLRQLREYLQNSTESRHLVKVG